MLGTLIFEWDNGEKETEIMLNGKISPDVSDLRFVKEAADGNRHYAKKLVEIAKYYGFDGYLMNFECTIRDNVVLIEWLNFLTQEIHKEIPNSLIIWYDSVLHDGSLIW